MSYEELIDRIMLECRKKGISVSQLAKLSSLPVSTIYGVFRKENKAQLDTLSMMLKGVGLSLMVKSSEPRNEKIHESEEAWMKAIRGLTKEKRLAVWQMVKGLGE